MTKPKAIILAVFTVWPVFYMFLFMAIMFSQFMMLSATPPANEMPLAFKIIFPLHFFTMLEIAVMIAIYIRHIFKSDAVAQDKKALWAVVIFLGNMIAMPVYWYLYIWKKIDKDNV